MTMTGNQAAENPGPLPQGDLRLLDTDLAQAVTGAPVHQVSSPSWGIEWRKASEVSYPVNGRWGLTRRRQRADCDLVEDVLRVRHTSAGGCE